MSPKTTIAPGGRARNRLDLRGTGLADRAIMRISALLMAALLAGCAADKTPDPGPDFGSGDDGKADSATRPASTEPLAIGTIVRTSFDASARYRAFLFEGKKSQRVDLYVDGLADLDTTVYLYRARAGKPIGRSLAYNDDTSGSWIVSSNQAPNDLSSSLRFYLPETGSFALVASTYDHAGVGAAEILIDTPRGTPLTASQLLQRARAYAWAGPIEPGYVRKVFATEAAAYAWQQANLPNGGLEWLAHDGETILSARFVEGSNDLWSQRFDIDRVTGAVTVTHEH